MKRSEMFRAAKYLATRCLTVSLTLCLAAAATFTANQQSAEKKPDAPKPIALLSWLVGGVWTADASKMGAAGMHIETRYQWADNNAFLRFNTHFVSEKGTLKNYDGNLFWDPDKNALAIWYMDAKNGIIAGPMTWDGSVLQVNFRGYDFEGKMADLKVDVTRVTNDHYHWAVSEKQGDTYKDLAALDYLRTAGS